MERLELVTEKQAQRLKKLGFDIEYKVIYKYNEERETCDEFHEVCYTTDYKTTTPPVALALQWLRNKYKVYAYVSGAYDYITIKSYNIKSYIGSFKGELTAQEADCWEAAERILLDKLMTLIEDGIKDFNNKLKIAV